MKRYEIVHRAKAPKLDPRDDAYWERVPAGVIDLFPWYERGDKQQLLLAIARNESLFEPAIRSRALRSERAPVP